MPSNDTSDHETPQDENVTELIMKAEGSTVHIWVVVNGEDVFHAAPHVAMSKHAVFAAVKTFYSRAFADHVPDIDDTDEQGGLRGIFQ